MGAIEIRPRSNIDAKVEVPGSKSITQRALELASLADGPSELKNILVSDDTKYMIGAFKKLGVKFEKHKKSLLVTPPQPPNRLHYDGELSFGNAGTAIRFSTGVFSLGYG